MTGKSLSTFSTDVFPGWLRGSFLYEFMSAALRLFLFACFPALSIKPVCKQRHIPGLGFLGGPCLGKEVEDGFAAVFHCCNRCVLCFTLSLIYLA